VDPRPVGAELDRRWPGPRRARPPMCPQRIRAVSTRTSRLAPAAYQPSGRSPR
jgi:hypothetical protein